MKKKIVIIPLFTFLMYILLVLITISFGFFGKNYLTKLDKPTQQDENKPVYITLLANDKVETIELEEYLRGVITAEMPASFEIEALKAQAVAARTYTYLKTKSKNKDHPNATVCANPAHCKAYLSKENAIAKFGADWENTSYKKISTATDETKGKIVVYNGQPISAVFFSTSSGMTENSKDVWGGDVPYLVSVKSEGDDSSPRYLDEVTMNFDAFKEKINSGEKKATFTKDPKKWITNIQKNQSGSVAELKICDTIYKGIEIRTLLGIRSTNFEIKIDKNVDIKTKGYGHGVGLSQYGANYMAQKGYNYEEILKKYYTGVEMSEIK